MAVTVVFDVAGMTANQYDRVMEELDAAGEGSPEGRLYHVSSQAPDGWFVVDIWESQEALDRFAPVLMPILEGVGVDPPQPKLLPTHNVVEG